MRWVIPKVSNIQDIKPFQALDFDFEEDKLQLIVIIEGDLERNVTICEKTLRSIKYGFCDKMKQLLVWLVGKYAEFVRMLKSEASTQNN